jgi:simple sugar transport system ATP-binding protein
VPDALNAVRMTGIVKNFGPVQALRGADFSLAQGEIHALLGENGAGKSTLMHILYGLASPDAGAVEVFGTALPHGSPRAARAAGLGMVHQHFSQVPRMSVAENVALGRAGLLYDHAAAAAKVREVGESTGLTLDPGSLAEDLSAGLKQRLEIVKALAGDVRVLILDEPTAVLTPGEVDDLFIALRRLAAAGLGVVLITHKLREVKSIADRVTVLRRGSVIERGAAADFTTDQLARALVGEGESDEVIATARGDRSAAPGDPRRAAPALEIEHLTVRGRGGRKPPVSDVSLVVQAGEVVAIAAVEGNGQRELMRAIAGLEPFEGRCHVAYGGEVGVIPEDRQHEGLVLDFSILENLALGDRGNFIMDQRFLVHRALTVVEEFAIRAQGVMQPVRELSGGNQQRVVLARVLGQRPALLVAENPTRGLDVRATSEVHNRVRQAAREHGLGVLFYSTDLDEVLAVGDRVGVMAGGRWHWADEPRSREHVGALMLGTAE